MKSNSPNALTQGTNHQLVPVGQRAKLLGFYIAVNDCTLQFSSGSAGDTTLFEFYQDSANDRPATFHHIPDGGMLFDNGINVTMASSDESTIDPKLGIFYEA